MKLSLNKKVLLGWFILLPAGLYMARLAQLDINNDRKKRLERVNAKRRQDYLQKLEEEKQAESSGVGKQT